MYKNVFQLRYPDGDDSIVLRQNTVIYSIINLSC